VGLNTSRGMRGLAVAEATKADAEADEKIKIAEEAAAAVLTT
jgi:hypothetical protein